jgi:hypothetical protein
MAVSDCVDSDDFVGIVQTVFATGDKSALFWRAAGVADAELALFLGRGGAPPATLERVHGFAQQSRILAGVQTHVILSGFDPVDVLHGHKPHLASRAHTRSAAPPAKTGPPRSSKLWERLYFDPQSGLLFRRYSEPARRSERAPTRPPLRINVTSTASGCRF